MAIILFVSTIVWAGVNFVYRKDLLRLQVRYVRTRVLDWIATIHSRLCDVCNSIFAASALYTKISRA